MLKTRVYKYSAYALAPHNPCKFRHALFAISAHLDLTALDHNRLRGGGVDGGLRLLGRAEAHETGVVTRRVRGICRYCASGLEVIREKYYLEVP